jgi:hypothetical protein
MPLPESAPLSALPPHRHFADVGWVSMHSALGRPDDDIHLTFKSSPYGSFSHSHADQNAFILNAYGENLAINSAYREYHNSPHHREWTRQTISKNALLIDGLGQRAQSKAAVGSITRFETGDRHVIATGDATPAYATLQPKGRVKRVTRDIVFIDRRYFVVRDRVELVDPGKISWLLHAARKLNWDDGTGSAFIRCGRAALTAHVLAPGIAWRATITDEFPVPVDSKYAKGEVIGSYLTGGWGNQQHLTLESSDSAQSFTVWTVLWPERDGSAPAPVQATWQDGSLTITRPDGGRDRLILTDDTINLY